MLINLLCMHVEYPNQLRHKGTQEGQKKKSVDENQKPPFNRTFVSIQLKRLAERKQISFLMVAL